MARTEQRSVPRAGLGERLVADGLVLAVLALWWIAATRLPEYVLPGPVQVLQQLLALFSSAELVGHTLLSAVRVLGSVVLAVIIGAGLALVVRYSAVFSQVVEGRILPLLNSFPSVGWAILAVIWFNISNFSVMFVQVMILIPFCLINVVQGLKNLDVELAEMGYSFSRRRARIVRLLLLPMLMPFLMSATRIAYGVAWKIALVSELFGADSGLGYLMLQAQVNADATMVLATCFAIVIMFFAGERLILNPIDRLLRQG
jgi:NitT/TauT family transport system permease protein/sulfonate transport system permease protein